MRGITKKLWKTVQKALKWSRISLPSFWRRDTLDTVQVEPEKPIESTADQETNPSTLPIGSRWAISTIDLSGTWKPIITPEFKKQYDTYLEHCGEGIFFRKALLAAIGIAKEVYEQRDHGRELSIKGITPINQWERTLRASGAEQDHPDYEPTFTSFRDPDGDTVEVEAWWEENGTVHRSMLRGKPRVKGGVFESRRYLLPEDDNVLVCESTFHPPTDLAGSKFQEDTVEWRFQRE